MFNLYQVPFTDPTGTVQNPEYQIVKTEYLRLTAEYQGVNVSDEFGLIGDFIGGQPVTLENHCFKPLLRTDQNGRFVYHLTLKVDGTRYFMFRVGSGPYNGYIYFINRTLAIYKFLDPQMNSLSPGNDSLGLKSFLLDGELVYEPPTRPGTGTTSVGKFYYLAFDILYHNGQSVIPLDYYTRNGLLNEFVKGYLQSRFSITNISPSVKLWFNITDILLTSNVYSYIQKETITRTGNRFNADGLILQSFDGAYITGPWNKYNNIQFKWKPLSEQTIDFRIKVMKQSSSGGGVVWHLLQKNNEPFKIPGTGTKGTKYQVSESTETAICIPKPANVKQFSDGDVAEFKWSGVGNRFVLLRAREYGKEPNSLGSIMSIWNFIQDPFTLDILKPTFRVLTGGINIDKSALKTILGNYSKSDLVLCALGNNLFFKDSEIKQLAEMYSVYLTNTTENELEFRLTKTQTNAFNFEYLFGYLSQMYPYLFSRTFDILKNEPHSEYGTNRSTYLSEMDIIKGTPLKNQLKKELSNIKIENPGKGLYGNFNLKIALSREQQTKTITLLNDKGKVNNKIRMKERWSFKIPTTGFTIDLTRVKTGYSIESLAEQRFTYEIEGELTTNVTNVTNGTEVPFNDFLSNLNKVYIEIIKNINYC